MYSILWIWQNIWHACIDYVSNLKVAVSDVYGDFTYEDVYLRSWDLAKGILGLLGQVCLFTFDWFKTWLSFEYTSLWLYVWCSWPSRAGLSKMFQGSQGSTKRKCIKCLNEWLKCFRAGRVNGWHSCALLGWPTSLPPGLAGWVDRWDPIPSNPIHLI